MFHLPSIRCCALLLFMAASTFAADDGDYQMRSRVYCDASAGISFRYPYAYVVPDQYKSECARETKADASTSANAIKEITVDGKKMKVIEADPDASFVPDVRCFSALSSQLPPEIGDDLKAIGNKLVGRELQWEPYDYYAKSDARPFAAAAWAPKGVQALIGRTKGLCAVVMRHGERCSGLSLTGGLNEFDNQQIIDSFEVLSGAKGKVAARTWCEDQDKLGHVLDATGKSMRAEGHTFPASWNKGWEVETAHYHITSNVSPARLIQYGNYLEALYKAYINLYEPDGIPPYKMEIHLLNSQDEFMAAAAANGFPVGKSVGGFFAPHKLAIFAYQGIAAVTENKVQVENVLAHECSHQFLHMACNGSDHVPTWFNEGLAVYFEAGYVSGSTFILQPPSDRVVLLQKIYRQTKSTLHPLDQYLDHHGHINPADYGEAYAMTHFWIFGSCENDDPAHCKHKNCGLARFRSYWKALKQHQDGAKAFEDIFMKDMIKAKGSREAAIAAWEDALLEYVKRLR